MARSARRRRSALALLCAIVTCACPSSAGAQQAPPGVVTAIRDSASDRTGTGKLTFAPGQRFDDIPFLDLVSYEGEWKDGRANGQGLLLFTPTTSGGYLSRPGETKTNYYLGEFRDGRPSGEGKLVLHEWTNERTITGMFGREQMVFAVDGQDRAVVTRLKGDTTRLLVRLMQYPNVAALLPSRIFFGEVTQGAITGDWVDVPWYESGEKMSRGGFGRFTEQTFDDGGTSSCTHEPRPADPADLTQMLFGSKGGVPQYTAGLDRQFQTRATCLLITPDGWRFNVSADFSKWPVGIVTTSCRTPDDKKGDVTGTLSCREHTGKKQDVFTNIGREFKRFVDRRIIGSLDKAGGSFEKAMCRATGTEPGKNCNVNVAIGASWPVGEGAAPGLPADEQAARQRFIAASRRATRIREGFSDAAVGTAAGMSAELDAVCVAICESPVQRRYSETLLSELERVAAQPTDEAALRRLASINRETASVAAGIRLLVGATAVLGPSIAFYRFAESARQQDRILSAIQLVHEAQPNPTTFAELQRRNDALAALHKLQLAHLSKMPAEGAQLLSAAMLANLRVLRGLPPQRASALAAAIALGRTAKEVTSFVDKYKDVKTEAELYDALIAETLAPLGIPWPPKP